MDRARPRPGARPWAPRPPLRPDRGMVTAETAVALPFVLVVAGVLLWVVGLGVTQVRLVDAAREGARAAARGDGVREVAAEVRREAPDGARVRVVQEAGTTEVEVTLRRGADLPLLASAPGVTLRATSVSATEGSAGPEGSGS